MKPEDVGAHGRPTGGVLCRAAGTILKMTGLAVVSALTAHAATVICYGVKHTDGYKRSDPSIQKILPCVGPDGRPVPPGCSFHGEAKCWQNTYAPDGEWYGHCDNSVKEQVSGLWCHDRTKNITLTVKHAQQYSCTDGATQCNAACWDYITDPPQNVPLNQPYLDETTDSGDRCAD